MLLSKMTATALGTDAETVETLAAEAKTSIYRSNYTLAVSETLPGSLLPSFRFQLSQVEGGSLAVPIGGFFFLDQYQESLIDAEIEALRVQGQVFAGAIGAGAVLVAPGVGQQIDPVRANLMLRRLTEPTQNRARLFADNGAMITDTQSLQSARGAVRELAPAEFWNKRDVSVEVALPVADRARALDAVVVPSTWLPDVASPFWLSAAVSGVDGAPPERKLGRRTALKMLFASGAALPLCGLRPRPSQVFRKWPRLPQPAFIRFSTHAPTLR